MLAQGNAKENIEHSPGGVATSQRLRDVIGWWGYGAWRVRVEDGARKVLCVQGMWGEEVVWGEEVMRGKEVGQCTRAGSRVQGHEGVR